MFEIHGVLLIPLIVGLVEALKIAKLPNRWLPLASLIFGLAGGIFYIEPNNIKMGIIIGLMLGLSASGLYSSSKNMFEKKD